MPRTRSAPIPARRAARRALGGLARINRRGSADSLLPDRVLMQAYPNLWRSNARSSGGRTARSE
jgi:hypothetical protein